MSTPVLNTPPSHHGRPPTRPRHQRTSTAELSKQMQRMIDIQNQHFEEYGGEEEEEKDMHDEGEKTQIAIKTPFPSVNTSSHGSSSSSNNNKGNNVVVLGGGEPGVGQGQLIFSHESLASKQHRCRLNSGSSNGSSTIQSSPATAAATAATVSTVSSAERDGGGDNSAGSSPTSGMVGPVTTSPTQIEVETTAAEVLAIHVPLDEQHDDRKLEKQNESFLEALVGENLVQDGASNTENPETVLTSNITSSSGTSRANYGSLSVGGGGGGGGGGAHHQGHDFHYGNPDMYHDQQQQQQHHPLHHGAGTGIESIMSPNDGSSMLDSAGRNYYRQQKNISKSCCYNCCCWLWQPIVRSLQRFSQAEALHRSFCFGAIDGMLTGSGIVSAFCGLDLVPMAYDTSKSGIFAVVLCFSAAACFADSICMGLGHMWTTRVAAMAAARERHDAKTELQQSRAAVKGHLVDMLLARGMLKMDAMSLADTLEGYPDLFVNVMVGEALVGGDVPGGDQHHHHHPMPNTNPHHHSIPSSHFPNEEMDAARRTHEAMMMGGGAMPPFYQEGGVAVPTTGAAAGGGSAGGGGGILPRIFSYGQLHENDLEPPETLAVKAASRESRDESFMMMLSFTLFGILPAALVHIVWATTSSVNNNDDGLIAADTTNDAEIANRATTTGSAMIHPQSLAIAILACIAWTLGVWKARFLDSNWLMFGIEAVVVLMVCIAASYGVGAFLNHLFLPDYTVQIRTENRNADL